MTSKTLFYAGILIVGIGVVASCSKKDNLSKEQQFEQLIKYPDSQSKSGYFAKSTPTRKAKQVIFMDPETGQQQIFYDCREAGSTCDVGENPPPPPPPNGRISNNQNETRNATISKAYHQTSKNIEQIFSGNKIQLQEIFPNFYRENIQSGLKTGRLKFISNASYIALVENTNEKIPVFVYLSINELSQSFKSSDDSTKTRVAKLNTETGVIECKEPGKNCSTRFVNNFNISRSDYLKMFETEFKNTHLNEAIHSNSYKIYETKNYIKLETTNEDGETFYVLK